MERIQALIDKLYHQKQQNSNPAQLLITVQLLQSELLKLQQKNGTLGTAKVAVTLPVNMNFQEEVMRSLKTEQVAEIPVTPEPEVIQPLSDQPKEYALRRPAPIAETEKLEAAESEEPISRFAPRPQQVLNPAFHAAVETPTL